MTLFLKSKIYGCPFARAMYVRLKISAVSVKGSCNIVESGLVASLLETSTTILVRAFEKKV